MIRVALIIPYFGKWPPNFNIFLKSCMYNDWLDVLFFTDIDVPIEFPENVNFIRFTVQELEALISKRLTFEIEIENAYKLCDYKPSYGFVFQDYIKEYDFWGFSDIDLVFGKVGDFIEKDITDLYDVVCVRKEWCSGSFSLFRNIPVVNRLFMTDKRFREVFRSKDYRGFDECGKLFQEFRKGISLLDKHLPPNFTQILLKAHHKKRINVHFKTLIKESLKPKEILCWDRGKILNHDTEYLLYHYITEKKKYSFFFSAWDEVPDKFFIDDTGFYKEEELRRRGLIRIGRRIKGLYKFGLDILPRAKKKYFKNNS